MLIKIFIYMIVFAVSSCGKTEKEKITVIGTAWNAKRSAIIVTDSNQVFYIDKLFSWDPKLYGKKVKVNGELFIETNEGSKEDVEVQEIIGSIRIIKNAKWEITK
jgi:hypothetical protein